MPYIPKTGPKKSPAEDEIPGILESFEEDYRGSLQALPAVLFPQSEKHGKHSYTLQLGWNPGLVPKRSAT